MGHRIELTARAYRDFKKLPKHVQAQVASRIVAIGDRREIYRRLSDL